MKDLPMPDDRPSYWAACEEKDFDQLSEFIVDSLKQPSDPRTEDPRSKEEFLSLWEMLREKYDAQVKSPEPDKLSSKRARLRNLLARVEELEDTPTRSTRKRDRRSATRISG